MGDALAVVAYAAERKVIFERSEDYQSLGSKRSAAAVINTFARFRITPPTR